MLAFRSVLGGSLLLGLVAFVSGACLALNELSTGRDVTCQDTPETLCFEIVDFVFATHAGDIEDPDAGRITTILVSPMDCRFVPDEAATRCWEVEVVQEAGGVSAHVHERADGSLAQ
jgi:hypothetical protein